MFSKPLCERIFIHKKLRRKPNYISVSNGPWYESSMVRIVYGTNSQWYERSMGRMVYGTNGLHVVRIDRGTNSQWYEKSSNPGHLQTDV